MIQLETKENAGRRMMFGGSPPVSEDVSIPLGQVYACEDLLAFEGTVRKMYRYTGNKKMESEDEYHFFVDTTGFLFVFVATEKCSHVLRTADLLQIHFAVSECDFMPLIRECAVVFLVPPGSELNVSQRMSRVKSEMVAEFEEELKGFSKNQFVVEVEATTSSEEEEGFEDEGEDEDEEEESHYDYWGLPRSKGRHTWW
eukprot:gene27913-34699_t